MTAPDVAALAAALHAGCLDQSHGPHLMDARPTIAALAAQGYRVTDEDTFSDGIDRAAERVISFYREGDTLEDIVAHIRGEQP